MGLKGRRWRSAGTVGNAGIYRHRGAVAIPKSPAGDVIQANKAAYHAGDPMFLSRREQDPAGGLPPLPPAAFLISHTPSQASRSRARLRAPRLLGAWDRQRFSKGIGFNRGITRWSSPVAELVPAHPSMGLTPCPVEQVA